MLIRIDQALFSVPSTTINAITFGSRGATLCARLYLYRRYISQRNVLVNSLIWLIDSLEKDHCEISARYWRARHLKRGVYFPKRYRAFLELKRSQP